MNQHSTGFNRLLRAKVNKSVRCLRLSDQTLEQLSLLIKINAFVAYTHQGAHFGMTGILYRYASLHDADNHTEAGLTRSLTIMEPAAHGDNEKGRAQLGYSACNLTSVSRDEISYRLTGSQ